MSDTYSIPSLLIKDLELPKPILVSEKDTFAYPTFKERIPHILEETMTLNNYSPAINNALANLRDEIASGMITPLTEEAPDKDFWNTVSKDYLGTSWFDAPWLWAEFFFYRRILEATTYFHGGPYHLHDPFLPKKQIELQPEAAPSHVADLLDNLPSDPGLRFATLMQASLWGNRFDLSHTKSMQLGNTKKSEGAQDEHILVDDSKKVWELLKKDDCRRLAFVTDNTGYELLLDLALIDFLLSQEIISSVELHVKPQPIFVSDVTSADINPALDALRATGRSALQLAGNIKKYLENNRITVVTHWFYATHFCFYQLSNDLLQNLKEADLVIFKGDANYRRLVGDLHWPPTTSFQRITEYLPSPSVALRTLKSDVIVGLEAGLHERLKGENPANLLNGHYGVIQAAP